MGTIPLPIDQSGGTTAFLLELTNTYPGGGAILGNAYGTDQFGDTATGVAGQTDVGQGVSGGAQSGVGVQGYSDSGQGVTGQSGTGVGVQGYSDSGPGVTGQSGTPGGVGQSGTSSGTGVYGTSVSGFGVYGETNSPQNAGVAGMNSAGDGVRGTSNSPLHAGVSANNTAPAIPGTPSGFAIWAGDSAIGIYAEGTQYAAYFVGNTLTTGTHTVNGDIVLANNAGDCAEEFDVTDAAEIEPGTVMVLDEHGAVRSSSERTTRKSQESFPGLVAISLA